LCHQAAGLEEYELRSLTCAFSYVFSRPDDDFLTMGGALPRQDFDHGANDEALDRVNDNVYHMSGALPTFSDDNTYDNTDIGVPDWSVV
jgi:hypothetical protein